MSHVPHELAEEFPAHKARIHTLKTSDAHFGRLFDAYHDVNREIHRAEAAGVNISDDYYEDLKKKRIALKDELYAMFSA